MAKYLKDFLIEGLSNSAAFKNDKKPREKADEFLQAAFRDTYDSMAMTEVDDKVRLSAQIMIDSISNMRLLAELNADTQDVEERKDKSRSLAKSAIFNIRDHINRFTRSINEKIDALEERTGKMVEAYGEYVDNLADRLEQRLETVSSMVGHKFDSARSFARSIYYRTAVAIKSGQQAFMGYDSNQPQRGLSDVTVLSFRENMLKIKHRLSRPFDQFMLNLPDAPADSLLWTAQTGIYKNILHRYEQIREIDEKYEALNKVSSTKVVDFEPQFDAAAQVAPQVAAASKEVQPTKSAKDVVKELFPNASQETSTTKETVEKPIETTVEQEAPAVKEIVEQETPTAKVPVKETVEDPFAEEAPPVEEFDNQPFSETDVHAFQAGMGELDDFQYAPPAMPDDEAFFASLVDMTPPEEAPVF